MTRSLQIIIRYRINKIRGGRDTYQRPLQGAKQLVLWKANKVVSIVAKLFLKSYTNLRANIRMADSTTEKINHKLYAH